MYENFPPQITVAFIIYTEYFLQAAVTIYEASDGCFVFLTEKSLTIYAASNTDSRVLLSFNGVGCW
jgi:hypothetical protein